MIDWRAPVSRRYTRLMVPLPELGVTEGELVLVDSSALIYLVDEPEGSARGVAVGAFAEAARAGRIRLAVSAIAWTELLAGPIASGDGERADRFRNFLANSAIVRIEPLDVAIAEEAARIRGAGAARRGAGLEFADALHIATAIVLGADAVLTNDEAWKLVPGCPRVLLVDDVAAGLEFDNEGR
jgi:predicted nucleic acid-binding protein